MYKFVNKNVGIEITVREFMSKGLLSDSIIFYHTSKENYPCFLKAINDYSASGHGGIRQVRFGFVSPVMTYVPTFIADTPEESIQLAMKSRQVFTIPKSEWRILFNFVGTDVD